MQLGTTKLIIIKHKIGKKEHETSFNQHKLSWKAARNNLFKLYEQKITTTAALKAATSRTTATAAAAADLIHQKLFLSFKF